MPQDGLPGPSGTAGGAAAVARRKPVIASAVLATMIVVAMEVMFFTGLVSAFVVVKAGIKPGMWPPPWQPRLPVEVTAVNSVGLIISGVLLFVAAARYRKSLASASAAMMGAMLFGLTFVAVQGFEWVRLLKEGLTLSSSNHGAFFYLIVGTHALHVCCGLIALVWAFTKLRGGTLTRAQLGAVQIFWTFVVGLWPILYTLVYL